MILEKGGKLKKLEIEDADGNMFDILKPWSYTSWTSKSSNSVNVRYIILAYLVEYLHP